MDFDKVFTYHPATTEKQRKYLDIRNKAKELALVIYGSCPVCADSTAAIRKVREAVMTANAAIALDGEV